MNFSRESLIERKLVKAIRGIGGLCPKFTSPGLSGVPDRIILLPEGKIAFAEVKAPNGKMRPIQLRQKQKLESLGFKVYVVDSMEVISEVVNEIRTT